MLSLPPMLPATAPAQAPMPKGGLEFTVQAAGGPVEIFAPPGWSAGEAETLTVHFHTAAWLPIQAHHAAGAGVVAVVNRPGLSSAYRVPFSDPAAFPALEQAVRDGLGDQGRPCPPFAGLRISSFSAGYGAVRELVQQSTVFDRIRSVILCDSLYASLDSTSTDRRPDPAQIAAWLPLAQAAARGEKEFVVTVSEVPTDYASSSECASAIISALGGSLAPAPNPPPVREAKPEGFALLRSFVKGRLRVGLYEGSAAPAHMAHVWGLGPLIRTGPSAATLTRPTDTGRSRR
jgi:hypothetical protein